MNHYRSTSGGSLRRSPPRPDLIGEEIVNVKDTTITVDGRLVRDVLWMDPGYIVIELDGSESRYR